MASSDAAELFHLCEKITAEFLPTELEDFKNEGMLRIEHVLQFPKTYGDEKYAGLYESGSAVLSDEFSADDIRIFEETLRCIPLIIAAAKSIIEFRKQLVGKKPHQEQVAVLKKKWSDELDTANFPKEKAREITEHYAEDLARIAAK